MAFIEAGFAELTQLMLPYMRVGEDQTVWTAYRESQQMALEESS
jgi:hypothetical protein